MSTSKFLKSTYDNALELISLNRIYQGKKELEKLYIYNPKDEDLLNLLFLCNLKYCNFSKAQYYINKSLEISISDTSLKYKREIDDIYKTSLPKEYNSIVSELKKGNLKPQIPRLEYIHDGDETLIDPVVLLTLIYYEYGNFIKARKYASKGYKLDNSNYYINNIYLKLKL